MSGSLQDQLMNMGLANKKQAKEAKAHKRKESKKAKNTKKSVTAEATESQTEIARKKQVERDKALNQQRLEAKLKRAEEAEVKQLIESNIVEIPKDGDIAYNFVHGTTVKKLHVDKVLQSKLMKGLLSIAVYKGSYRLVPTEIAERIHKRDPELAICIEQKGDINPDDPYADYEVPDDLMW